MPQPSETEFKTAFKTESQIEQTLVDRVRESGGLAFKWVSPAMSGVPDRIVVLPGGRIVFVELKRLGERLRPLQARVHRLLEERGADVRVIDSVEAIDRMLAQVIAGGGR